MTRVLSRVVSCICITMFLACGGGADGPSGTRGTGDADSGTPTPQSVSLAQVEGPASGADCPNGGVTVAFGVDVNTNGELDEDEINRREAVCNGVDGADAEACAVRTNDDGSYTLSCPNSSPVDIQDGADGDTSLIREREEPAGNNCENGGIQVAFGVDTDGDGELDDEEVTATRYVCNGDDGTPGTPIVLTDFQDEPPGEQCANGGIAIRSGADTNRNGQLDDDEVTNTAYVCRELGMGLVNEMNGGGEDTSATDTSVNRTSTATNDETNTSSASGSTATSDETNTSSASGSTATSDETNTSSASGSTATSDETNTSSASGSTATSNETNTNSASQAGGTSTDGDADSNAASSGGTGGAPATNNTDDNTGSASDSGQTPKILVRVSDAATVDCANGGVRIETGLDVNNDDRLDASEVQNTQHVCNGRDAADGPLHLTDFEDEPEGVNCERGGIAIRRGVDGNRSGQLDAEEVEETAYVCNVGSDAEAACLSRHVYNPCSTASIDREVGRCIPVAPNNARLVCMALTQNQLPCVSQMQMDEDNWQGACCNYLGDDGWVNGKCILDANGVTSTCTPSDTCAEGPGESVATPGPDASSGSGGDEMTGGTSPSGTADMETVDEPEPSNIPDDCQCPNPDDICFYDYERGKVNCRSAGTCNFTTPCPDGYSCNQGERVCACNNPADCGPPCTSDAMCSASETCEEGVCTPKSMPDLCLSNDACDFGEICAINRPFNYTFEPTAYYPICQARGGQATEESCFENDVESMMAARTADDSTRGLRQWFLSLEWGVP